MGLEVFNKLYAVKSSVRNTILGSHLSRREIGNTYLTHTHLLKMENQPECVVCQSPLEVEHFILKCVVKIHLPSAPTLLYRLFPG
jgi:hypothetical protein